MKILKASLVISLMLLLGSSIFGQSMEKKYKTVKTTLKINAPAKEVWKAMVLDYGNIGNFSPYIYASNYINGSLKGEVGAQRKCSFNKKGSRWVHEKIVAIDHEKMVMTNIPFDGKKLPLNFDNSRAFYTVVDNGDGTSTAGYEFQYRTKPAFMGGLVKGSFKKQLAGTLVGLKHHVETGEIVNANNKKYKEIKNKYPKPTVSK